MNLDRTIHNAYAYNKKVGREKVYFAIDIHDTIAQANYADAMPDAIETAMDALRKIKKYPEIVLILFSSSYRHEEYISHFLKHGVEFTYFNENPEICDTKTGDFSKKFFYNVLIDDKGGFELRDWDVVVNAVEKYRHILEDVEPESPELNDYILGYQFDIIGLNGAVQYGPFMSLEKATDFRKNMISENEHRYSRYSEFNELMSSKKYQLEFAHFSNPSTVKIEMAKWKEYLLDCRPEFKEMDDMLYVFEDIKEVKIYI